jgi:hypothetical protein
MTTVIELTRFLQWALADGPLPSAAIKRAMEAKGLDSRSQKQMTAARRRAGVILPKARHAARAMAGVAPRSRQQPTHGQA